MGFDDHDEAPAGSSRLEVIRRWRERGSEVTSRRIAVTLHSSMNEYVFPPLSWQQLTFLPYSLHVNACTHPSLGRHHHDLCGMVCVSWRDGVHLDRGGHCPSQDVRLGSVGGARNVIRTFPQAIIYLVSKRSGPIVDGRTADGKAHTNSYISLNLSGA